MKLDSQIAIVYELQRFSRYKSVTVRILEGLKTEWSDNSRLIQEINITISKLK